MKLVFISNYYNHHQAELCEELHKALDAAFVFIQAEEMSEERRNLGWGQDTLPPYVKKSYGTVEAERECLQLLAEADVVILGAASNRWIENRIRDKKIVLRYSERLLKRGVELWKYPYRWIRMRHNNPKGTVRALLCASAYTAADYASFGLFKNRCYKWGYFPEVKRYTDIDKLIKSKHQHSLLWVGRYLDWKHPEVAIAVAERLKKDGYEFTLSMIGTGPLQEECQQMIKQRGLADVIDTLGPMSPTEVRAHMEQAEIFLFTSDRYEGWGAVLNESMNSACAVVSSHAIGAAPYLIKNGENGFLYRDGNMDDLYEKVKALLDNPVKRERVGRAAYETLCTQWNPKEAAKRVIQLSTALFNGETAPDLFAEDICSKAPRLKDNWFK